MFSSPDEGAHMIRAAGILHGELSGTLTATGDRVFEVPSVLNGFADPPCYAFRPTQTASCMKIPSSGGTVEERTTAASYPPFYHALVALPLLLDHGVSGLYMMRAMSAIMVAALLALAVVNAIRIGRPSFPLLGLAVAITPMALFLGGTVNPSGPSIAAGTAAWIGGYLLMRETQIPVARSVAAFAGPLCVLLLLRRDAVLWALVVLVAVCTMATAARLVELAHSRRAQLWTIAIGMSAALQLATSGGQMAGSFVSNVRTQTAPSLSNALGDFPRLLREMVGVFGYLDVQLPAPVYHVWLILVGLVVLMAIGWTSRRMVLILVGLLVAIVAVPTAIGTFRPLYMQGRYILPVAVGLPIVAGCVLAEHRDRQLISRRLLATCLGIVAALQIVSFHLQLRRYSAGIDSDWWYFSEANWEPPVATAWVLTLLYAALVIAGSTLLYLLGRSSAATVPGSCGNASAVSARRIAPQGTTPVGRMPPVESRPLAGEAGATASARSDGRAGSHSADR
jgi:hypothetical protein